MPNFILPQKLKEEFLSKWQGEKESIGYAIAHRTDSDLVCLVTIRTGVGSAYAVKETNEKVLASLTKKLENQAFDILPAHSHPIQGLSPTDKHTLEFLAKFGYHNVLVIEPKTIKGYNTTKEGLTSSNPVVILPNQALFEKHSEQYQKLIKLLLGDLS